MLLPGRNRVNEDFSAMVKTYRKSMGWTQEELAQKWSYSFETISAWERGKRTPSNTEIPRLAKLLEVDADTLVATIRRARQIRREKASQHQPMLHHESFAQEIPQPMIRSVDATRAIPEMPLPSPSQGMKLDNLLPSLSQSVVKADLAEPFFTDEIPSETLEDFAALTEICRRLSEGNELKTAERILWNYLPRVESAAKLSLKDQRTVASITSQSYLLAASLAGQRNDLQGRHHFSEQALLYGKLAQDRNLQITALRQLSITFDYLERPDKVLQIFQQAFPYLDEISPLLRACIYAGVSGAHAQMRQEQETLRFMDMAYEQFPVHPEFEPGYLHTICRYSSLVFFDGLNHLELGRPLEAEKVLARIDGLQPKIQIPERVRIELLNYQVEVFMTLRYMEQACTYLEAAVHAAMAIGSERRFQEALRLFRQMQQIWPYESQIQRLGDLFAR